MTYKIQRLDTPPFGHFMRIAHVTEAPSTGASLFKQAEETQITIKKIIDLHRRFLKWKLIVFSFIDKVSF